MHVHTCVTRETLLDIRANAPSYCPQLRPKLLAQPLPGASTSGCPGPKAQLAKPARAGATGPAVSRKNSPFRSLLQYWALSLDRVALNLYGT